MNGQTAGKLRLWSMVIGACAALALWALGEAWGAPGVPPMVLLAGFSFVLVQGGMALALCGPLAPPRALIGALWLALPVTALICLAGLRYNSATSITGAPTTLAMAALLVLYGAPFVLVRLTDPLRWQSYAALFEAAWTMHLRFLVALVFAGLFWLMLFLSNELLKLVDVRIIEALLRRAWLAFALTGALVGLGAAVVHELRGTISPYLVLRLLRLMLPVALAVVVVFLATVPLRPLADLFGEFSAAGILMGTGIGAITLVSAALDQSDAEAVQGRVMHGAARLLAVLVALLCGLALWAVWLRVDQYGWTPDRLLAFVAAGALLAYGAGYAASALAGRGWMGRVRRINVTLALGVIGLSALWMTPVLDPYRITVSSQIARFGDGRLQSDKLPLWEMAHDWGRAGQAGLDDLAARGDAELSERAAQARAATTRYRFNASRREAEQGDKARQLAALLPVRPEGAPLADEVFVKAPEFRLRHWLAGCRDSLPDGRPGCVLVMGLFEPANPAASQGMLVYRAGDRARADLLFFEDGRMTGHAPTADAGTRQRPDLTSDAIARLLDGDFEIRETGQQALRIGGVAVVRGN